MSVPVAAWHQWLHAELKCRCALGLACTVQLLRELCVLCALVGEGVDSRK